MGRGKTRSTEVDSIKWYEANAGDNVRRNEWKTAGWRTQQERTMFICSVSVSGRELNERRMLHLLLLLLGINDVTAIFSAQRQATREDNNKMRWFVLVCRAMSSFSPHRPAKAHRASWWCLVWHHHCRLSASSNLFMLSLSRCGITHDEDGLATNERFAQWAGGPKRQ